MALLLLASPLGLAQNAPITFETGQFGSTWAFNTFENGTGFPMEVVANPFSGTGNTSATVAHFTASTDGQPWAGCETIHGAGIGTFNLTYANCIVKVWVRKPVLSDVAIKFARADGAAESEIKVANTVINAWQQLTFDFHGKVDAGGVITNLDQIVVFPDFRDRGGDAADTDCYFDNITFSAYTPPPLTSPPAAAPTPTASYVVSMFSNAYTNIPMSTWRTVWSGGGALTDLQIAGNDTKKYESLAYFGAEPVTSFDVTAMSTFNIDLWTADVTTFRVKLVDYGSNGVFGGGDDVEHEVTLTSPTLASWNSYHIPLSSFAGLVTKGHIGQLIPSGSSGTIFIDNVYFSGTAPTAPVVAAAAPTGGGGTVISLFSNAYTNIAMGTWRTGWSGGSTLTDLQIAGNDTKLYQDLGYFGVEPATPINASAMTTFHVDVWTPDVTTFRVKLVCSNGSEQEVNRTTTLFGWNRLEFALSEFPGATQKSSINLLVISQPGTGKKVYLDNIYFSGPSVTYTQVQYDAAVTAATAAGRVTGHNDVTSSPGTYSLYTTASIQDLKTDGSVIVNAGATTVNLTLPVQKSLGLNNWSAAGTLQLTLPKDADKQFYRLAVP